MTLAFTALFGALGSVLRYLIDRRLLVSSNSSLPLGTFCVNCLGAFALGVFYKNLPNGGFLNLKIVLGIGFCGGLTTFSTLAFESYMLLARDSILAGIVNILINSISSLILISIGYLI